MLLFTDTYMPMYPDRAEKKAPRRKAMPTSNLSPIAMIIPNITLIIAIVFVLAGQIGHGSFADGVPDGLHLGSALVLPENASSQESAIKRPITPAIGIRYTQASITISIIRTSSGLGA
jgi:hypothetical protein